MAVPDILARYFYGPENALMLAFTELLLVFPILIINKHFFTSGFKSLFMGGPNMDTLVAVGSGAALVYGIFAIYRIGLAVVVALLLIVGVLPAIDPSVAAAA